MNQKSAFSDEEVQRELDEVIAYNYPGEYFFYLLFLSVLLTISIFVYDVYFSFLSPINNILLDTLCFFFFIYHILNPKYADKIFHSNYFTKDRKRDIRASLIHKFKNNPVLEKKVLERFDFLYNDKPFVIPKKFKYFSWLFTLYSIELFFIYAFTRDEIGNIKLIWKPELFDYFIETIRNNLCFGQKGFIGCIHEDISVTLSMIDHAKAPMQYAFNNNQEYIQSKMFEAVAVFHVLRTLLYLPYLLVYGLIYYHFLCTDWLYYKKINSFGKFLRALLLLLFLIFPLLIIAFQPFELLNIYSGNLIFGHLAWAVSVYPFLFELFVLINLYRFLLIFTIFLTKGANYD